MSASNWNTLTRRQQRALRMQATLRGMELTTEQRVRRYEAIKQAHEQGRSLRDIGREWGIAPERVRMILLSPARDILDVTGS